MNQKMCKSTLIIAAILLLLIFVTPCSAALSSSTVALGDTLTVSGEAPGARQVAIYIFGPNYFHYAVTSVDNRQYEYKLDIPMDLSQSQYFCIVQSPGTGTTFTVAPVTVDGITYITTNPQIGVPAQGSSFIVSGSGALQSSQAANALEQMINSPNIPDLSQTFTFQVVLPRNTISVIGTQEEGTSFTISGTTNIAAGNDILVDVNLIEFLPTDKNENSSSLWATGDSGTVVVRQGSGGSNTWSFQVKPLAAGSYRVIVSAISLSFSANQEFSVVSSVPTVTVTTALPTVTTTTEVPTPAPTESYGFGVMALILAIGAVAVFRK